MFQQQQQGYGQAEGYQHAVARASVEDRAGFITRTYLHLMGSIFAFIGIIAVLFMTGAADPLMNIMLGYGQLGWLVVLGLFMGVSYIAQRWAQANTSIGMQYAGLGLYVVAEAVIFVPLIGIAMIVSEGAGGGSFDILGEAAVMTCALFAGLTAIVFVTRKDFSFLRGAIMFGGLAAMGLIIVSAIAGFSLGLFFMWAMVALAAMSILYNTSNVMLHYNTNQHVAAALQLFASFALLLWYVIQILMSRR